MNTLEIKLPDAATDITLPRVGEITIKAKKFTGGWSTATVNGEMRVENGTIARTYPTPQIPAQTEPIALVGASNAFTFVLEDDGYAFVGDKYSLTSIDLGSITSDSDAVNVINGDFRYSPLTYVNATWLKYKGGNFPISKFNTDHITTFEVNSDRDHGVPVTIEGSISDFKNIANMTSIKLTNQLIYADLNTDFNTATALTYLSLANCSQIIGDVKNLGNCISCTTFTLNTLKQISGTIESLFDALYANGRHSGTVSVFGIESSLTFNGVAPTTSVKATFTDSGWSQTT